MPTQSEMRIPVPQSADEFENICLDYVMCNFPNSDAQRYGRQGQKQHGIDIFVNNFKLLVQCKRYYVSSSTTASKKANELVKKIREDYDDAKQYFPDFHQLIIMTTFDRDTRIQDEIHQIDGNVHVIFWDTIEQFLCEHLDIFKKYYPQLISDNVPQKFALFLTEVDAFISFEDRKETDKLRKHYQSAKEAGLFICQFSDRKEVIKQILNCLDELFPDIVNGETKRNTDSLEEQIRHISENGSSIEVHFFDNDSKDFVSVSELEEDSRDFFLVRELREQINAEQRCFMSRVNKVKRLLESLKAAM